MGSVTGFDPWEKDPFFSAAEEVQQSCDRMESVYRVWIQEGCPGSGELRQELVTSLGSAKWQLEELEQAVVAYDDVSLPAEDTVIRHDRFFEAIRSRIVEVESSLRGFSGGPGVSNFTWVNLDKGERDELARFLSGNLREMEDVMAATSTSMDSSLDSSKNSFQVDELSSSKVDDERVHDHETSASDSCYVQEWKISIPSQYVMRASSSEHSREFPAKMLNFLGFTNFFESSSSKIGWYSRGFRKGKTKLEVDSAEGIPLTKDELKQGLHGCCERSKDCFVGCGEDCCDRKQLYGWLGAFHRQLQRSQYQIQYGRPMQPLWALLAIILIVIIGTRAL